jgi:hypothetical protein
MLTEMIVGRPIAECRELIMEHLIKALDGAPPHKLQRLALMIGAPRDVLSKWPDAGEVTSRQGTNSRWRPVHCHNSAKRPQRRRTG